MSLPSMLYGSGIGKYNQTSYGGYNHNLSAMDGQIYDMTNMSSDYAPLLSPRAQRYITRTLTQPNGLYANDGLYWVDGTAFYADGVSRGTVSAGRKTFAALGAYIIIMPDMAYYNKLTREFGSLNAAWTGAAQIADGTYGGETAKSNTIEASGVDFTTLFKPGDGITISGATVHPGNNKTIIVREVAATKLVFYENSFVINDGGDAETALTLSREMPEIDFLCENENRLWGCKGARYTRASSAIRSTGTSSTASARTATRSRWAAREISRPAAPTSATRCFSKRTRFTRSTATGLAIIR